MPPLVQPEILIDNDTVALRYHPASKIVHHEFKKFVFGDQFREVLEKGLETLEKYRASKWLSDDRGNNALRPEDSEWATNEWAPRVIKAGWKYWAVVMPEKTAGQMNMRRWLTLYGAQGVTAEEFSNPDEAMRWLEAQGE